MLLEVPEDVFWYADVSFVEAVVDNKSAYDGWVNYVMDKERQKQKNRMKHRRG